MGIIGFGKRIKPRNFGYIPRHYDPAKEELQERLKRYKINEDGDPELSKQRIRGSFRRNQKGNDDYTRKTQRRSNRILLITLLVLLFLTYLLLTNYLPAFAESLGQ